MARPFLRPRWLLLHLLVLAVAAACVGLGVWQLRRLAERRSANAALELRRAEAPRPLGELLAEGDPADLAQRRARAVGRYDAEREVLWQRGLANGGEPGYQVLTPLLLADGRAILVERGWVPFALSAPPVAEAAPPAGEVTVEGALLPSRGPPEGFWANLAPRNPPGELAITAYPDTERLSAQMPYALVPVVLELASQTPPQPGDLPVVLPEEPLSDGPHLGYAIQWFSFALIGLVGYGFVLRRMAVGAERPAR